ncbi:MAG: hypothetical protein OES57_01640 [Acidimicrobiia bacterium]|nr:hypothetical protein [Acidimicrobiia bacterium]
MDLWVTIGVLVKRWYITLPLLALVGVAAVQIGNGIEPTYTATATARVYCPSQARDQVTGEVVEANRYCSDGTTDDLAFEGAVNLNSNLTRIAIRDLGLISDYVIDDTDASVSLVYITADADDEEAVVETLQQTVAVFVSYVDDVQSDNVFKYTAGPVDIPQQATATGSSKTRTQIIVVVAGIILTTILVHIFDAALHAWKKRNEGIEDEGPDDQADRAPVGGGPDAADAEASPVDKARDAADDPTDDWEEAKKLFDDEVEKLTSESSPSRWGR